MDATNLNERAQKRLEDAAPQLLIALKRALFVLESPAIAHLADGAGTLSLVRDAIRLVDDDPDMHLGMPQ